MRKFVSTTPQAPPRHGDELAGLCRPATAVLHQIAANPKLHAAVYGDVRKAVVPQFPYIVLYRDDPGEVVVIAVFHTARDPSVWQSRA